MSAVFLCVCLAIKWYVGQSSEVDICGLANVMKRFRNSKKMLMDKEVLNLRVSRVCSTALGETISGRSTGRQASGRLLRETTRFRKNVAVEWVVVS
jgi:hypothetical protein